MTGPKKGSRGRTPKRNTAQGRGGATRDSTAPVRERTPRDQGESGGGGRSASGPRPGGPKVGSARSGKTAGGGRTGGGNAASRGGTNPARRNPGERGAGGGEAKFDPATGRKAPPRVAKKPLPERGRVQLDAPPPETVFRDRDGQDATFPDSSLKRVAARLLSTRNKAWRYRPFSFPLFTDSGNEQAFHFDFYVYDAEDSVIRLILVVPFESREVWDRIGRFKRQYPMYTYELWTPERLAQLERPRARLGF
ncbi:hypothetical protein [Deinococcus aestuarii]|uniref:hypothetical protein n=1 Tax=Deinococcus aestuarii TaxID=2774531 RepID=UPI001C0D0B45|nr:hypothetical protein [Deinococcus aestuarii]